VIAAVLLVGCDPGPASNSSGQLSVTGDLSWGGALKGIGLAKTPLQAGYNCEVWLYDQLATYGGDSHPGDRNATYVFGLQLGSATGLSGFPTGPQAQGDASQGTSTPWPSQVRASFDKYEGFKHGDLGVYTTGGTVTITQFDAQRLTGSYSLTGYVQYCTNGDPCTLAASGDFDITNVECAP
jgi:hypothetical protein